MDVGTRDVASRHILIACLRLGQFEEDVRTGCEVDEARYSFSTTTGSAAASPSALCRQALEVEPEVLKVAGQCNDPASSLSIGVSDQQSVSCVGQCFVEVVEARFKWKLCEQRVTKASGAISAATLGATIMRPFVGDSGQFIPRTIAQIVEGVQQTGATVRLVEAYPS